MTTPEVDVQWSVVWKVQMFKGHERGKQGLKSCFASREQGQKFGLLPANIESKTNVNLAGLNWGQP